MKKVIFTQRVEIVESYGERRDCIDQQVVKFILECGYLPIAVSNVPQLLEDFVEMVNPAGIILTGGNSLVKYGGNAPERDLIDARLLKIAEKKQIPLYGFCRGMQSILDYYGVELQQVKNHVAIRHEITGEIKGCTNSYHNQGCFVIEDDRPIDILARASDGVVEAIRHKTLSIWGTMWHPERENPFKIEDISFLKNIFE